MWRALLATSSIIEFRFETTLNHQNIITMALAPKFSGQKFAATSAPTLHTLELYLDYVCPFSAKMFSTVYTSVFPLIQKKYASKVQILFRQQIQPWHPSSTLVHEAGVAVLKLQPAKFWDFSKVSLWFPSHHNRADHRFRPYLTMRNLSTM